MRQPKKIKKPLIPKRDERIMYKSPAVPPTLVNMSLASFILNAENGKHYWYFTLAAQRRVHDVPG